MFVEPLAVPSGARVLDVLPRLALALDGGHPLAPYAVGSPPPTLPAHEDADLPDDLAVVVGTSGSTGAPKLAMLTAANLLASIEATATRIGGHGHWLVTLPGHHIAGLQVLLRSLVAGTSPTVMDLGHGFTPAGWAAAVDAMPATDDPTYASIVPTQLVRLLADTNATQRLARFTAVLVGGAATHPDLIARAVEQGVNAVTTYGMSETAGGCVYSGHALGGTIVSFEGVDVSGETAKASTFTSAQSSGRILLAGPTVAAGYLGDPTRTRTHFRLIATSAGGERSEKPAEVAISRGEGKTRPMFVTDDVGHLDDDGQLHVDGRIDDLVNTGGLKVAPRIVEEAVTRLDGIVEAVAVGVPDPEWGHVIGVAIVTDPSHAGRPRTVSDLRTELDGILDRHALPRALRMVPAIPSRGPGKPDRAAVSALFDAVGE